MTFFDPNLRNFRSRLWLLVIYDIFEKLRPKHSLIIRPRSVLRAAKRKPSKNTKRDNCPVTVTQYCSLLSKIIGHNQNHGSRQAEHFFLVSRRIILENYGSGLLMKSLFTKKNQAISHLTGKKSGHSRITEIPFTTLFA